MPYLFIRGNEIYPGPKITQINLTNNKQPFDPRLPHKIHYTQDQHVTRKHVARAKLMNGGVKWVILDTVQRVHNGYVIIAKPLRKMKAFLPFRSRYIFLSKYLTKK